MNIMKMNKKDKDKIPNITNENEQEYWLEFKKTLSPYIREALIIKYSPLVKYVASKISVNMGSHKHIEFQDLVGFGSFGLMDAIDKYNPNRDIKFKTYAVTRIRGAIYDELRKLDYLPRSIRKDVKEIEKAREILEARLSRNIKPQEIADMLGIPISKYNETMKRYIEASPTSLSDVWYVGDDSDEISVIDTLKSNDKTNPEYLAEREDVKNKIIAALKKLPEKEQQVLILYYYDDLTLKEIGKVLEVSESRISQLHTKAIQQLRYSLSEIKKQLL
ncbi:RNA polymerase sigma factor WhiG [Brachyspira hyodysenteriae WA1]|uniref:RNA polymerase sigma factor WhiG n=2 Tax=Brachyspira hyodysenteriae TaxID=159 RepID=A0A3B6V8A3_BRAHW|nr:RNA polymerase sigma factor WhiG [Brachyspira hyodysenteriae WA1]